jgi:hypothetical protein
MREDLMGRRIRALTSRYERQSRNSPLRRSGLLLFRRPTAYFAKRLFVLREVLNRTIPRKPSGMV